jgi:hypothetical protein
VKKLGLFASLLLVRVSTLAQGGIPGLTSTPITFSGHADDFVAGPDGNVWLVDSTANAIGRLAVDGSAYQAFPVPTPAAGLNSIVAGPDGNLWFTESSVSKVGRITISGAIMEFTVPAPFVYVLLVRQRRRHDCGRARRQPLDQRLGPDGQSDASGCGHGLERRPRRRAAICSRSASASPARTRTSGA